jgi:hypothetical protein
MPGTDRQRRSESWDHVTAARLLPEEPLCGRARNRVCQPLNCFLGRSSRAGFTARGGPTGRRRSNCPKRARAVPRALPGDSWDGGLGRWGVQAASRWPGGAGRTETSRKRRPVAGVAGRRELVVWFGSEETRKGRDASAVLPSWIERRGCRDESLTRVGFPDYSGQLEEHVQLSGSCDRAAEWAWPGPSPTVTEEAAT